MAIRTLVDVQRGMELVYDPPLETLASQNYAFARKHAGMKAKVLDFEMSSLQRSLANMARALGQEPASGEPNSIFVEFQNGDRPEYSISHVYFRLP